MSDIEEESFCFYGKPLDPYDEEAFPSKKPITVEEQIATDAQGRRRFHGAFTGGFSAGFFNTVGSLEGWTPSEFKSTRNEKQKHVKQNPEDFMDDEDMGEFGFAPQSIRATKDYDTSKKRKRKVFSDGPIPGEPVLHSLLTAGNETVGYLLLKNIGIKEKIKTRVEECSISDRVYGCEMPNTSLPEVFETKDYELPEFYNKLLSYPKNDTFGLGYIGLDKSHVNLFRSSDLIVQEKNKKLSIRGQAFGVGAFENDDDDIYAKEDMSNYDFELVKEKEKFRNKSNDSKEIVFNIFMKAKVNTFRRELYTPPVIPKSFTGKHKVKKSRFEPLKAPGLENNNARIDSTQRAKLLGEETIANFTASKSIQSNQDSCTTISNMKVKIEKDSLENSAGTTSQLSKPSFDPNTLWNDRFVTGAQADDTTDILTPVKKYESDHYSREMKDAVKLKMFGALTRISEDWQPCALLCKRFNVPEPFSDKPSTTRNRIKMKNLIFEYQKHHEENVAFKSGLTHATTEVTQVITIDDNQSENNSVLEVKQETNGKEMSDPKFVQVKQENMETKNDNEIIVEKNKVEVIDITDRLNIEEKEDLFRAVFLSSSESEEEDENEIFESKDDSTDTRELELKSNILGEDMQIPKIKHIKEGILSGLNFKSFHAFTKPVIEDKNNEIESQIDTKANQSNLYGPKLPEKIIVNNVVMNDLEKIDVDKCSDSSSDEWVEKDDIRKSRKKKLKKSKSSHKKKHKHKKKKH